MRVVDLELYRCPDCTGGMELRPDTGDADVEAGELSCRDCSACFPIIGHIPRFVPTRNYADSFALQWEKFPVTQYDSHSEVTLSSSRFFESTGFPEQMDGDVLLVGAAVGGVDA